MIWEQYNQIQLLIIFFKSYFLNIAQTHFGYVFLHGSIEIGGCVIYPCRLSSEKAHMQLALFGPTQSGCDAAEVSSKM